MIQYLTTTQTNKEYTINYNLAVLNFMTHPVIKAIVTEIPENQEDMDGYLMINPNSTHHNKIIFFIYGKAHFIEPKPFLRVYLENTRMEFNNNQWREIND